MKLCECGCGLATKPSKTTNKSRGYVKGESLRFLKGHHMRIYEYSPERREEISRRFKGRVVSEDTRRRISEAKKGKKKTLTQEHRDNLAAANRIRSGHNHPLWKDRPTYSSLHSWVNRNNDRTGRCSSCGVISKTDWANVSGEYLRDLKDYVEMCRFCHRRFDRDRCKCGASKCIENAWGEKINSVAS